jgi:hypothetical protein
VLTARADFMPPHQEPAAQRAPAAPAGQHPADERERSTFRD